MLNTENNNEMITLEFLKANRESVITTINANNTHNVDLKIVMSKVVEYAEMPCYDLEEELKGIVIDATKEANEEFLNTLQKEGVQSQNFFNEERAKVMRMFNANN